jgi:hypothetical protein
MVCELEGPMPILNISKTLKLMRETISSLKGAHNTLPRRAAPRRAVPRTLRRVR